MEPSIIKKPEMTLVGIIGTGSDVSQLDIYGLWTRFDHHSSQIKNQVKGKTYEVHIQEEREPKMHFCIVGVEVKKIEDVAAELFIKTLPAGQYAVFAHSFSDGGFDYAFKKVYDWVKRSSYQPAYPYDVQYYDERFKGPDDPGSIYEIHVPIKSMP